MTSARFIDVLRTQAHRSPLLRGALALGPLLGFLTSVTACGAALDVEPGTFAEPRDAQLLAQDVRRIDLKAELGIDDDERLVGVTLDPVTQERFVLAGDLLDAEGRVVWDRDDTPGLSFNDITDVTALGDGTIAVTSLSDGFLVDVDDGSFTQHFCYEPCMPDSGADDDWCFGEPDEPIFLQVTHSLGYDDNAQEIVAQPQDLDERDLEDPQGSYLALYDRTSGDFLGWDALPFGFRSHGLALDGDRVWMGRDATIVVAQRPTVDSLIPGELQDADIVDHIDLSEAGIEDIQGMVLDTQRDVLLILDGATQQLFEVPMGKLRLASR